MIELECQNCKNKVEFEVEPKSWVCGECGSKNPPVGILAYLIAFVFVYFLIRFLFWIIP